jgi:hypothetical protein
MPDGFGGASANALICRAGGIACGFKAVAMNAAVHPISTPRRGVRFTIARPAVMKSANGKSW